MARKDQAIEEIEEMLLEAWELHMRLPDRERGWLASGSRSGWPQIVRDRLEGDYPDVDARPRQQLSRREMALVDRVFLSDACLTLEVAPVLRPLLAVVLALKVRPGAGGFSWPRVWGALGGRESGVTSETLRKRYERLLTQLALVEAGRSRVAAVAISGR